MSKKMGNDGVLNKTKTTVELTRARYNYLRNNSEMYEQEQDKFRRWKLEKADLENKKLQIELAAERILKMNPFQFIAMKRRYRKENRKHA